MSDREQEVKQTLLRFDSRVFTLAAVKKAAYKYINSFTADIKLVDDQIVCTLAFASPANEERFSKLIEEFKKEVLDQDLRETHQD